MKNYFNEIFRVFSENEHGKKTMDAFYSWLADSSFSREKETAMRDVWEATKGIATHEELEESLASVYRKAGYIPAASYGRRLFRIAGYAAAAVVFAFVISGTWWLARENYSAEMTEVCTVSGDRKTVTLPDGTVVRMNSSSIILYPEKFTGKERTVYLVGEADFKVEKDASRPFVVRLGDMDVTALGTEFNISSYPEDMAVTATLIEGKVMVACGSGRDDVHFLEPGEQVVYERVKAESRVETADMEVVTAWQDGVLLFRSVTVREIARELQRKYGARFIVDSRTDMDRYNFRFKEDASVDEVLEILGSVIEGFSCRKDTDNDTFYITVNP